MNILFVTDANPLIVHASRGGHVRSKMIWKSLCSLNSGDNYLYTVKDESNNPDNEFIKYRKPCRSYRSVRGLFEKFYKTLAGLGFLPESLVRENDPRVLFPGVKFDIIVGFCQRSACLFPYYKVAPFLLDYDDHPIQSYDVCGKYYLPLLVRPFAKLFNILQFRVVRRHIAGGWLSNMEQAESFGYNVTYLPNVVPFPDWSYDVRNPNRDYLFTIGVMSYIPNCEGVDRFVTDVWPGFHAKYPNARYVIAGKDAPDYYYKRWNSVDGVDYIGFVEDQKKAYENCIAAVVPIWRGSGTAIKTREAMAYSRCCISSELGARGLENVEGIKGRGLFIFSNVDDFSDAYSKMENASERQLYENNVFEFEQKYSSFSRFENSIKEMFDKNLV